MPSFDIVSEINIEEARNGSDNATRDLATRFDFRNVEASFEYKEGTIKVSAPSEFQVDQMMDILRRALTKRKVDPNAMTIGSPDHTGKVVSKVVEFMQGIDQTMAKKLVKLIKDSKLKVQASIQGDKVRVTGKKRDDLQSVMALVRDAELDQPFQFENFRD